MSLLQHPIKSLDQIEWYLDNSTLETFPGAFLLAAGNLSRQVVEQVLFILAFYSGLPRARFMKSNNQLLMAAHVHSALQKNAPDSKLTYVKLARLRGPRIKKFARNPVSLRRWIRVFNEASHFANPVAGTKTKENDLRKFVNYYRAIFDEPDAYLITAAVNEIGSKGFVRAVLGDGPANIPGVEYDAVVKPKDIFYEDGKFGFRSGNVRISIVPETHEVPRRWKKRIVLVQNSSGMTTNCRFVTDSGHPVDISDFESVLRTFAAEPKSRRQLIRHLSRLGFQVEFAIAEK